MDLATEIDYQDFIEVGYAVACVVDVYMDHIGVNVQRWIIDGQLDESVAEDNHYEGFVQNCPYELQGNVHDDLEHVDCNPMNKTINDEFLSKLCPKVQSTPNSPPHEQAMTCMVYLLKQVAGPI